MDSAGAFLDLDPGMKTVACQLDEFYRGNPDEPAAEPKGNLAAAAEKFPLHVLVVDDEPLIRWSVAESLADLGVDVEEATDARSALKMVTTAANPFQVVILDLRLPDMHDLSLLGTLRQVLPHARLILMTAFGTPDVISQAMLLGADVVNKPFELSDLNRLVLAPSGGAV